VKVTADGEGVTTALGTPVPDSAISAVVLDPLMVSEIWPLTAPGVVGANLTPKELLWPGARSNGSVSPVMLKPVPVTFACEIVIEVAPEFCRVSVWVALAPSTTVPKLKLAGLVANAPARTPVPVSGTVRRALVPVFVRDRLPDTLPVDWG